jgi:hypothetical protein
MSTPEPLHAADVTVVSRYLHLRAIFHDHVLAPLEKLALERYQVQLTRRILPTLVAQVRNGLVRLDGEEIWPVIFLTPADITLSLCVQITSERLAHMGTLLNGPHRMRHRHWEDWWGWETPLAEIHPRFFTLPAGQQQEALLAWYVDGLEWLANSGLLLRKAHG